MSQSQYQVDTTTTDTANNRISTTITSTSNNNIDNNNNSSSNNNNNNRVRNVVAVARWKLLRQAIIAAASKSEQSSSSSSTTPDVSTTTTSGTTTDSFTDPSQYSIHSFHGYQLLSTPQTIQYYHKQSTFDETITTTTTKSTAASSILYDNLHKIRINIIDSSYHSLIDDPCTTTTTSTTTNETTTTNNENYNVSTENITFGTDVMFLLQSILETNQSIIQNQLVDQFETSLLALATLLVNDKNSNNNETLFSNTAFQITLSIMFHPKLLSVQSSSESNAQLEEMTTDISTTTITSIDDHQQHRLCTLPNNNNIRNDNITKDTDRFNKNLSLILNDCGTLLQKRCLPELEIVSTTKNLSINDCTFDYYNTKNFSNISPPTVSDDHRTIIRINFPYTVQYYNKPIQQSPQLYTIQQYTYQPKKIGDESVDRFQTYNNNDDGLPNESLTWYTREKLSTLSSSSSSSSSIRITSIRELVSHQYNNNIDNTGNICVWDCSKVLTWVLLEHEIPKTIVEERLPRTILELGIGMAALPGLSSYSYFNNYLMKTKKKITTTTPILSRIVLTDGHIDCVRNNRINIRLCQAAAAASPAAATTTTNNTNQEEEESIPDIAMECHLLKWTFPDHYYEPSSSSTTTTTVVPPSYYQADWTIVADCLHFVEYHVALLWTIVQNTNINGQIWLCQPDRGTSLQKFLSLIDRVNNNNKNNNHNETTTTTTTTPLLSVTERFYDTIEQQHDQFLVQEQQRQQTYLAHTRGTTTIMPYLPIYNPNKHKPRIYVLQKLRTVTSTDYETLKKLNISSHE